MVVTAPKQGDIIWIDAEPHSGREEGGHNSESGNVQRPAVVISNDAYNQKTGLVVCMLMTHDVNKGNDALYYPIASHDANVVGSVITFQMPNYDFASRHGEIRGHVTPKDLDELLSRAYQILDKR
ncbi:type II toxin-antitoxin system PemK/MazF family toxin [Lactobacillus sp. ESL0791]|uniref:type II toxin-antitoxin system PemK/MazF family toxin n=1 Tax=Lactobacillus sp. ESL0791 TaxID=2983234 RepID=UPI0023F8C016|nr:type II toxin-antitoxin system PemK/MazF family toxin [Lactobacillus sp. ESL0791]MDF7639938.1 type II toxin-antitoxin system PemK/MazF family toxin [Lactobacillus sp. ESL0791]